MSVRKRAAIAAISTGVGLAVGLGLYARRPALESVDLADDGALRTLLESRAEPAAAAPERAAPSPVAAESAASPAAPPRGSLAALRALSGPIPEAHARAIFPSLRAGETAYDELMYYRRAPNLANKRRFPGYPGDIWALVTNDQGFREDAPLPPAPDRRIVVVGDSHTDGVCVNSESFANVLEVLLAERRPDQVIDVVNAGVGGYTFQNYAFGLDRFADLEPDVYVVAVYGGNDFLEVLAPLCYHEGTPLPKRGPRFGKRVDAFTELVGNRFGRFFSQGVNQLALFTQDEAVAARALDASIALTRAIADRAETLGVELVLAYVPPLWDVQLARYAEDPQALRDALGIEDHGLEGDGDRWAQRWIDAASELGVPLVDLRPAFRAAQEDLYWHHDHHINLAAHRLIAEALVEAVE